MMNITGVVGVQCVLFYIPNNFNVKVRLLGQVKRTDHIYNVLYLVLGVNSILSCGLARSFHLIQVIHPSVCRY